MPIPEEKRQKLLDELIYSAKVNLKNVNEELIRKSFKLSFEAHRDDIRASGEPYFIHPYYVALIIAQEVPLDDISVVGALLHDVVEDSGIELDFIEKEFSKEVADIVDGVTKIGGVFQGQEIMQAENYRKLLLSMIKDVRVILVKFADRLHNMRTLEYVSPDKQKRIAKETMEIYAPFANRFGLGRVKWELEDLAFKYLNNEAYNEIANKLKDKRREREAFINKFIVPISNKLKENRIKFEIGGRPKHLYSIYRKMIQQNLTFNEIYDLLAIRIIIENDDPNECFYVLGIINQLYKPMPDRFKDYISIPKKNNYQSIHNTVIGPDGRLVEIQIRTNQMHEIAEHGVAAHWMYKENLSHAERDLEEWVDWIRDIFEKVSQDEASREIIDSFSLNLYQDEIYVFTPQGDLKRLPFDSSPVDFAYEIHSNVGYHCIGAKVNGKIVPLDSKVHSGDQVEIITSKNQHPNKSWLKFVKTHKAKTNIRKYLNKEEEKISEVGKELWEKKIKKLKLSFNIDDLNKLSRKLKYDNPGQFFKAVAENKVDLEAILNPAEEEKKDFDKDKEFQSFTEAARNTAGGILVDGEYKGIEYNYAKCCNPIPGDHIVGYITIGEGIKIHRKNCKNLISMIKNNEDRLVPVKWPKLNGSQFVAGIHIKGDDAPGLLKDVSDCITNYKNTNIRSVNLTTNNSMFNSYITIFVDDLEHLKTLMNKLKKISGIFSVERFDSSHKSDER